MAERDLPGLGLTGFYNLGADGWKPGMDNNLLLLSAVTQLQALSRTDVLPEEPVQGDIYIVRPDDVTNPNKLAVYDDGAWVYLTPAQGWLAYVVDTLSFVYFNGASWVALSVGGESTGGLTVISDATASRDSLVTDSYVRMTSASANAYVLAAQVDVDWADSQTITIEQGGAGTTTVEAPTGVTINSRGGLMSTAGQFGVITLIRTGEDEWTLTGDLA